MNLDNVYGKISVVIEITVVIEEEVEKGVHSIQRNAITFLMEMGNTIKC